MMPGQKELKDLGIMVFGHVSLTDKVALGVHEIFLENFPFLRSKVECYQPSTISSDSDVLDCFLKSSITKSVILCVNMRDDKWEKDLRDQLQLLGPKRAICHVVLMGLLLGVSEFADECQKIKDFAEGINIASFAHIRLQDTDAELKQRLRSIVTLTRLEKWHRSAGTYFFLKAKMRLIF